MSQFIRCLEALMTSWNRNCRSKIRWDWERKIVARTDRHSSLVESKAGIILRSSLLEPCVILSCYTAPDILSSCFAHVDIIVAGLMESFKVVGLPVVVIAIDVM
jgi:hypothetical protein